MPRAFHVHEQAHIRNRLRQSARRLFSSAGVVKTSIDQLTRSSGISKGSFYKFYDSKERLYMELLEEADRIRAPLLESRASGRTAFEKLLHTMFKEFCNDPLILLMGKEVEFLTVLRRLPPEYLSRHQEQDQAFLDALTRRWNTKRVPPKRDVVAARMTLLVMVGLQRDFVGERLAPHAVDAVVTSLADCFF